MKKTICVLGTFDTKGEDFTYLVKRIQELGADTLVIDVGSTRSTNELVNIKSEEIVELGEGKIDELFDLGRVIANQIETKGAIKKVNELVKEKKIDGIISMGGSGALQIAGSVMKTLPVGFPKVLVTSMAGTPTINAYNNDNDVMIMNSIVDIAGVNFITKTIYSEAAGAIVGAVNGVISEKKDETKKRIAMTMYGVTTPGVLKAKEVLEKEGYDVIVFHATGAGGISLEKLINSGFFDGVVDMTTTEISNNTIAGETSIGFTTPTRCEGVANARIPCVFVPGAMDMAVAVGCDPSVYKGRKEYHHNGMEMVTHFRPNLADAPIQGACLGDKINKATAKTALFLPHGGLSMLDAPGQELFDKDADEELFKTLKAHINNPLVEIKDYDHNINDEEFAIAVAKKMIELLKKD